MGNLNGRPKGPTKALTWEAEAPAAGLLVTAVFRDSGPITLLRTADMLVNKKALRPFPSPPEAEVGVRESADASSDSANFRTTAPKRKILGG